MEWNEITNPEKGYIRGDRVVVEAHITIQKVVGVRLVCLLIFFSAVRRGTGIV